MKKLVLLFGLLFATPAFAADNAVIVTPGVGVTMKSKDIGGGVQAMQPVISDASGNALSTPTAGADGASNTSTGMQVYARPSWWNGATWDRAAGDATNGAFVNVKTSVLPTGAATAALQGTNTATTAHTCSVAGYSELGCLGQIDDDVKGPIAAGTNIIGKVTTDQTTPGTTDLVHLPTTTVGGMTQADPCTFGAKTNLPITSSTSALTQIIAASGSTKVYICSLAIISASAEFITFNTGTGTNCGTGTTGLIGGTTVGTNGLSLAANGGLTLGNGAGTIAVTGAGGEVCVALSGTTVVAGNMTYVQQ